MDVYEVVERLDAWAREAMIDHRTGVPPDAKFDIKPSSSSSLVAHERDPSMSSVRTRGFNLDFRFSPGEPDESVEAVEPRLRDALQTDPTLGAALRQAMSSWPRSDPCTIRPTRASGA
jgi:hypothetical protein